MTSRCNRVLWALLGTTIGIASCSTGNETAEGNPNSGFDAAKDSTAESAGNNDASHDAPPDTQEAESPQDAGSDTAHDSDLGDSFDGSADSATDTPADTSLEASADSSLEASADVNLDSSLDVVQEESSVVCAPVVAAADVDPWSVRAPGAGIGSFVSVNSPHQDRFLFSPSNALKFGVRLDWGGTVIHYGVAANDQSNTIDANDTGRELQIALYDPTRIRQPCAWNASCLTSTEQCGNSITYLGWNPVQGGDECNRGAQFITDQLTGDTYHVSVRPLQWNADWEAKTCVTSACSGAGLPVQVVYNLAYRFVREHVVEVAMEVVSQETFDHPSTGQEFPTLYVGNGNNNADLPLLLNAAESPIALSTLANDGFYYDNFTSPSSWVSWQNTQKTYGVAIAMDQGIHDWQGWRGNGTTAPYFHNVRAQIQFGLDHGGIVRGVSYLALGSFAVVKSEIEATLKHRPPFGAVDLPLLVSFTPGQPLAVQGWVLDTTSISQVDVEVDGKLAGQIAVNSARPDVCKVYPQYGGCPNVGFTGTVPTSGWTKCPHLVRIKATDPDGNTTVLGERVVQP